MPLAEKKRGLAERRAIKSYQESEFPALEAELRGLLGEEKSLEVDWESFYHQNAACQFWADNLTKVYFRPVIEALKSITADEMGREALAESIEGIKFGNTDNRYSDYARLEGNVLVIDHCPMSNVDDVDTRAKTITRFLEDNL